jgi:hypothetical protein
MTDQQEKIARYDTRQRGLELQKHLATLKGEIRRYAENLAAFAEPLRSCEFNTFDVGETAIRVFHQQEGGRMGQTFSILLPLLRSEHITTLLTDLELTKKELAEISKLCREMGDPLP